MVLLGLRVVGVAEFLQAGVIGDAQDGERADLKADGRQG
jgi:hypothetical protein